MRRGGGEFVEIHLARELHKLGVEIEFVARRPLFGKPRLEFDEFATHYVRSPDLYGPSHKFPKAIARILRFIDSLFFTVLASRTVNRTNADSVQITDTPMASMLTKLFRIPLVYTVHGKINSFFKRRFHRFAGLIYFGAALEMVGVPQPSTPYLDITPGVDVESFKSTLRAENGNEHVPTDRPFIVFVGRFVALKNLSFLIDSFNEFHNQDNSLDLVLVGDGPLYDQIVDQARNSEASDHIKFTGSLNQSVLPGIYSAASAFVMTSTHENFPTVLLEALACGLPTVAPRVGGIPTIIQEGTTGAVYQPGDIDDFVRLLQEVVSGDRTKFARDCRQSVVEGFGWGERGAKVREFHEQITQQSGE
jgi:glycosyltransferase involved in cell wall biosynthesis